MARETVGHNPEAIGSEATGALNQTVLPDPAGKRGRSPQPPPRRRDRAAVQGPQALRQGDAGAQANVAEEEARQVDAASGRGL